MYNNDNDNNNRRPLPLKSMPPTGDINVLTDIIFVVMNLCTMVLQRLRLLLLSVLRNTRDRWGVSLRSVP